MQQIANILEQPISLQTSPRKTRKRPYMYSLVLFIPVWCDHRSRHGAYCTVLVHVKNKLKECLHLRVFRSDFRRGFGLHVHVFIMYVHVHVF
jgi:hypothetical protein